jgi:hypothetical protein
MGTDDVIDARTAAHLGDVLVVDAPGHAMSVRVGHDACAPHADRAGGNGS